MFHHRRAALKTPFPACTINLLSSPAGAQGRTAKLDEKLKTYHLIFLKKGPHRDQDLAMAAEIQTA